MKRNPLQNLIFKSGPVTMSLTSLTPERQHDLDHQVESLDLLDCIEPLGGNQSAHNPDYGNSNYPLQRGPLLSWPTQTTDLQRSPPHVSIPNQGPRGPSIPQEHRPPGPPTGHIQRGQPSPDSTQGPEAIQNHIEIIHEGKIHGCNICGKSFTSDQNLNFTDVER